MSTEKRFFYKRNTNFCQYRTDTKQEYAKYRIITFSLVLTRLYNFIDEFLVLNYK